jgi:hypothetical protein
MLRHLDFDFLNQQILAINKTLIRNVSDAAKRHPLLPVATVAMPSQSSQQTPGGTDELEENTNLARKVYNEVWTEFYAKRPKDTFPRKKSVHIDTKGRHSRRALHDAINRTAEQRDDVPPRLMAPSAQFHLTSLASAWASSPGPGSHSKVIKPVLSYTWCDRTKKSIRMYALTRMPFVPTTLQDDRQAEDYRKTFLGNAWDIRGRNPDCESCFFFFLSPSSLLVVGP